MLDYLEQIAKDVFIFGTVKVGERGQIVIPLEARKKFTINPGDTLLVVGDLNKGIGITKVEALKGYAMEILGASEDKPLEVQEIPEAPEDESKEESNK